MSTSKLPKISKKKSNANNQVFPTELSSKDIILEETETAFQDYLKYGIYPPNELSEQVLEKMNSKQYEYTINGNYKDSSRCKVLIRELKERIYSQKMEEDKEKYIENKQVQIKKQEENIEKIEKKWERKIKDFRYTHEDRMSKEAELSRIRIDEYCYKFENPNNFRNFSKPSVQLLNMRVRERILLLANRFHEAEDQEKIGNQYQEEETEQKQREAEKEVQKLVDEFSDKEAEKYIIANKRGEHKMYEMEQMKEEELNKARAHLRKLQIDLDNCKISDFRPKPSSRSVNSSIATKRSNETRPSTTLMFRREPISTKLKVGNQHKKETNKKEVIPLKKTKQQTNCRLSYTNPYKTKVLTQREKLKLLPSYD